MPEPLRLILPVLCGYLLGSVPFGYLIVRLVRKIDIREYGSHNIGATNVLRVVGWGPALLTLLCDVGKGGVPAVVAVQPYFSGPQPNHWLIVLSTLAAIVGHAYSAFFYLKERKFARGKAVAAGAGAVIGFVAVGQVHWAALPLVAAVWVGAVLLPKVFTRRWGWVSLASILAALSLPAAFALVRAPYEYILFGVAAALFVVWKHKENIGRLLDGVEPRLGEKVPLAGLDHDEVACAFLIHPMEPDDWWQTRRFSWARPFYRLGVLPLPLLRWCMFQFKPIKLDTVCGIQLKDGRKARVYLLSVPWLPEMILAHPERAVFRAAQAAEMARALGARCLGLGAYWSVVGNKGAEVRARSEIAVTNGGAYTAGTVKQAVPMMMEKLLDRGIRPENATAAVVGANGVVGFGICRQLAGRVGRLVLVGTNAERLEKSAALLRRKAGETEIVTAADPAACREAHLVFAATSTIEPVVYPEHVRSGAVIYDLGRPADVAAEVLEMPGVTVIPGGVVRPPGAMVQRLDIHFGQGEIPACMAETLLIALDGCDHRASLGEGTCSENIDYFVRLAEEYGFEVVDEPARPETAGTRVGRGVAVAPGLPRRQPAR